jgi:hypothetical protein
LKNGRLRWTSQQRSLDAPKPAEFQFERPDWVMFRSVDTLCQKAGVGANRLRRLVLKELADNAADAGGHVVAGALDSDGNRFVGQYSRCNRFFVEDDGPGIPGTPEDIARLFSINRPLVSSKLRRLPSRGALGNGLRVVAGAVAASDGALEVRTRNRRLVLTPQEDGSTAVEAFDIDFPTGTRIEVAFGAAIPADEGALEWADAVSRMVGAGESYRGSPSPHWYDGDHWYELLQAAGARPIRDLVSTLDGCSGPKAGRITAAFKGMACNALSREQAVEVLEAAREASRPVSPERIGKVGKLDILPPWHALEKGTFTTRGRHPHAEIPFVVEAWVHVDPKGENRADLEVFVNRTPGPVRSGPSRRSPT